MKRYYILYFILLLSCPGFSQVVAPGEAKTAAERFFRNIDARAGGLKSGTVVNVDTFATFRIKASDLRSSEDLRGVPAFYIFNRTDAPGFVIIAADKKVREVIAWSDSSSICAINPGLGLLLDHYTQEIAFAKTLVSPAVPATSSAVASQAPLLGSISWNQAPDPYYTFCPLDTRTGRRCPAGCVATAMAEIIYYYKFPRVGSGSFGYNSNYGYEFADFGHAEYKYEEMKDRPNFREPNTEIAELSYHCGVAVEMDYNPDGSSAYFGKLITGFEKYFKYRKPVLRNKNSYTWDEWGTIIRNEIDYRRPVLYSAIDPKDPADPEDASGGHAFVVDGYNDQDQFHINWCWGGCSDGYYVFTLLKPYDCADSYLFSDYHSIITGIEPAYSSECLLSADAGQLNYPASGGAQAVNISSNTNWTVSADVTWLTVSKEYGTNSQTLSVTAAPNSGFWGRAATLSILGCDGSKTIQVLQEGECKISVSPANLSFPDTEGSKQILVSASSSWMASADVPWISLSPGSGNGNETLKVTVQGISGTGQRSGTITIWGCNITREIAVTQGGSCILTLSTEVVDFPTKETNQSSVSVTSNTIWTTASDSPWLSVSPASGVGNGTLSVTVSENQTAVKRKGNIVLTGCNTVKTMEVSQSGMCSFSAGPAYFDMNSSQGNAMVSIMTNSSWTAVSNDPWITCSPSSGNENGGLKITVSSNNESGARSGSVTIRGCSGQQSISVVQRASCPLDITTNLIDFSYMPGSKTTFITTPGYWTAQSESSWFTVTPKSGNGNKTITISAVNNTGEIARQGIITVSGCSYSKIIDVTQDACQFEISVDTLSFPAPGGNKSLSIKTYSMWNTTTDATWMTISPSYGFQPGNATITVSENLSGTRLSHLTISGCYSSKVVEIVQKGLPTDAPLIGLPDVKLFPSPAVDFVNFECPEDSNDNLIEVYSENGNLLRRWRRVSNGDKLDLKGLSRGLYFFRISSEHYSVTEKIVIGSR